MNNIAERPLNKMLSKSLEKYVNSLKSKKTREQELCYLAEGEKITLELLKYGIQPKRILCTQKWYDTHSDFLGNMVSMVTILKDFELEKISEHKSAPEVITIAPIQRNEIKISKSQMMLVLDGIQDPGNMGTIIRSADWFGIKDVYVSSNCVDIYNSKVIQSSMGSLVHIRVMEADIEKLLSANSDIPVIGADMNGIPIKQIQKRKPCFMIIGSEGKGISQNLRPYISQYVSIPGAGSAESLNAAIATSIILSHWVTS